jgi:formylglycine-generating enzyme required for sulfatase activity
VEEPVHLVDIGYDIYMGKYEITQGQWVAVMQDYPDASSERGLGNNYPVYSLCWGECQDFITALNQLGEGIFRLPSEAEWEYACRAGTTTRFYFGDSICSPTGCDSCDLDDYAWWCANSEGSTHPVGEKLPNAFGLFDMHGNVLEWLQDYWHNNYIGAPTDGSVWNSPSLEYPNYRMLRGGAFRPVIPDADAWACRSAVRYGALPCAGSISGDPQLTFGFRVVLDPDSIPTGVEGYEAYR